MTLISNRKYIIRRVQIATGGGSKHLIESSGISQSDRASLNFTGAGVSITDDPTNDRLTITIPGSSGASLQIADNITTRNNLTVTSGDLVFVTDATTEANINFGWAVYMYDGEGWVLIQAQESVTFQNALDDSAKTTEVGGIPSGTLMSALRDKAISELLTDILFPGVSPTYVQPTLSTIYSGVAALTIDVGEQITINLLGTFVANDAGAANTQQTFINVGAGAVLLDSGDLAHTDAARSLSAPGTIQYYNTVAYNEGATKNNNLGAPDATGKVLAGSITGNTISINVVYPYFWGTGATKPVTAANILAGNRVTEVIDSSILINFGSSGTEFSWFAVPETEAAFLNWFIEESNKGAIGGTENLFADPIIISVSDTWSAINYEVYITNYTTELSKQMTISQ